MAYRKSSRSSAGRSRTRSRTSSTRGRARTRTTTRARGASRAGRSGRQTVRIVVEHAQPGIGRSVADPTNAFANSAAVQQALLAAATRKGRTSH